MNNQLYDYLLLLGDNALILGHRLSELCGHGPTLETDIALTNISLDLFGQVRHYFQYASTLSEKETDEDQIAFLRLPHLYRNVLLVEQANTDFAHVITRQYLFDIYHYSLLEELKNSHNKQLAAIANKCIKEVTYHLRFSKQWMTRLALGTEESRNRIQIALNWLLPYTTELKRPNSLEIQMYENNIGANYDKISSDIDQGIAWLDEKLDLQNEVKSKSEFYGKNGFHSEKLGYILAELQFMQRTYPNMQW